MLILPILTTAQGTPIELGADVSFDMSAGNGTTSVLSIPNQSIRMGVFVSDLVSIENRVSARRVAMEGFDASTSLSLQMSGVIHFTRERRVPQGYVNPTIGLQSSIRGNSSSAQLLMGCGAGVKVPIADLVSSRFEVGYWYGSENQEVERFDTVTVKIGVAVFTR